MTNQYDYTLATQEKILAMLWLNEKSFNTYSGCIKPKYFQRNIHVDMCRILFDYHDTYGKAPSEVAMMEEIYKMLAKNKAKQKLETDFKTCIRHIRDSDILDYEYLDDLIKSFGKKQALIEAIMECAEKVENDEDTSNIADIISKAQMVGEDMEDLGMCFYEGYEERLASYGVNEDVIERIPTGMKALDKVLKGGLGKTEMGVILASPGKGKTTCLQQAGANALRLGKKVVHISLENNEDQIMRNYDTCILGHPVEYINENYDNCVGSIARSKKYYQGTLYVKKYPTKCADVNVIRMYLNKLKVLREVEPDVLIIDYGALLKPMHDFSDKRNIIESNYEDMRMLADIFQVALWTGAQGNRSSLSKKVVTIEDLSECFAIANTADFIGALCQTPREKDQRVLRMFIAKNRDGQGERLLQGSINYDTKQVSMDTDVTDLMFEEDEDEDDSNDNNNGGYNSGNYNRKPKGKKSAYDQE